MGFRIGRKFAVHVYPESKGLTGGQQFGKFSITNFPPTSGEGGALFLSDIASGDPAAVVASVQSIRYPLAYPVNTVRLLLSVGGNTLAAPNGITVAWTPNAGVSLFAPVTVAGGTPDIIIDSGVIRLPATALSFYDIVAYTVSGAGGGSVSFSVVALMTP